MTRNIVDPASFCRTTVGKTGEHMDQMEKTNFPDIETFCTKLKRSERHRSSKSERISRGNVWIFAILILCQIMTSSALPVESELDSLAVPGLRMDLDEGVEPRKSFKSQDLVHENSEQFVPELKSVGRGPRLQELRKSKDMKCKKAYRKSYCMNSGTCEWIPEINEPRCKCKNPWKGERCRTYHVDFTGNGAKGQHTIVIALVVSLFGVVGIVLVGCICWRRVKFLRKHRNEVEENSEMIKQDEQKKETESDDVLR